MKGLQFFGNRVEDANYFLEKLIADEEHHIKLLKEAMGMDKSTNGVTVIIK